MRALNRKILIVDDEPETVDLLRFNLGKAGFEVAAATGGQDALAKARSAPPDLILLDWMLPESDGLEVCKALLQDPLTRAIPIIMLSAKAAEIDRVIALELGVRDYLTKPFNMRELILRVKNVLRTRTAGEDLKQERFDFGDICLDVPAHLVFVEGRRVDLTNIEFKLLQALLERNGRVQSREQLLQDVWAYDETIDVRTVDTHIRRLRAKIGAAAGHLETIRGIGYRFMPSLNQA